MESGNNFRDIEGKARQPACGMGYPVVTRQLLGVDADRQLPVGEKRDLWNLDSSRSSRRETVVGTRRNEEMDI